MALQAAGDAPAVRLIHLVVTQALTQAVVVVEELRAQTKSIEKESNQRGYDLVDQFLDYIATAPIKLI